MKKTLEEYRETGKAFEIIVKVEYEDKEAPIKIIVFKRNRTGGYGLYIDSKEELHDIMTILAKTAKEIQEL